MARAKNRGYQQAFTPTYTIRRWRLGEYIRLSKEDLKKGKDDSNSVKNQRDLLGDFYQRHMDEFESAVEYVDDGHTGTDANRENFQRLLADVMSGKINCVIVKDLSRFARNYSDAGSLIDNLFVQMGVRFISLAENVDSYLNPDSVSNIIVPITNVMNDNYCYQTSKKIRQVFDYKRRNGQYIGSFAPYGYIKDPANKHQLLVDTEAAETVKRVYSMLLQGSSKRAIALYLNEHGILSPTAYRRKKGLPVSSAVADDPMWGARMIHEMDLTAAEYKLLCLFMRNPNMVLTKEQILDKLWDCDGNYIDSSTLTVYMRRLRIKIEDNPSEPQMLLTVRGMGYKWNVIG